MNLKEIFVVFSFNEVVQKDVVCCCSGFFNQFIGVYNTLGDNLSIIKYYEGFLGQRIGVVSCLVFYLYKVYNFFYLMYFLVLFLWFFYNFLFDSVFFMMNLLIIFLELLNLVDL